MNDKLFSVIHQVLRASAMGPFFPDEEFHALFGLYRHEIQKMVNTWPNIDMNNNDVQLAINNAFNSLLGYPIDFPEQWSSYIDANRDELRILFEEWRRETGA